MFFLLNPSTILQNVLSRCKHIHQVYVPPLLWGRSGHIQTAVYGKIGRLNCPWPVGKRHVIKLSSGETMSYDIFESIQTNNFIGQQMYWFVTKVLDCCIY